MKPWTLPPAAVLDELTVSAAGLSAREAAERLTQYGANRLTAHKPPSRLLRFLAQLKDPMILLLLGAAVLSLAASGGKDFLEPVIILTIVLANALISVSQEQSAQKALDALQTLASPHATCLRDGVPTVLPACQVVPGDVVLLSPGDLVPADGRLLSSVALQCDESAMTGESLPVSKHTSPLPPETPLADRRNMVLSSCIVTAGRGTLVVTATGMNTELGQIAAMLHSAEEPTTPLQKKLTEISKTLSLLCLAVCAVLFGVGLLQHQDALSLFLTAVALAVAAIPEGLPAIVTIVLALGVQRMAAQRAIVKKLPAVETLGCASVICSDKTGTLTQNKMTVTALWTVSPADEALLLTIGALCNNASLEGTPVGDPTELALLVAAKKGGIPLQTLDRDRPRLWEFPFDAQRKRMTVLCKTETGYRAYVKGAPDVLLPLCKNPSPLALGENDALASRALRVLGLCYRDFPLLPPDVSPGAVEQQLTFVGLVGLMDPPRPEVARAVADCRRAGIRPVMITGDHKRTAVAIAQTLGILQKGDTALTGADLDFIPQPVLESEISRFSVFARVTPAHKMRIVQAWQKSGAVVAMTGDGINDAPALKAADIGCAMGKSGTDVAKSAGDMILTDDNFSTIVAAVAQGRGIYANIKKSIHYLLSCNIGELLTIAVATLFGFSQIPLVPVQLLWLNLVTDSLPALALGVEPVEDGVMDQPPRDSAAPLFSKAFSLRLLWQGGMVGALTLGAYAIGLQTSPQLASTMAFSTLTLSQLFHAYDVRSEKTSIFHLGILSNPAMNRAFLAGLALQLSVLLIPPLMAVFSVVAMTLPQWLTVLSLSVTPLLVCETAKALRR